MRLLFFAPPESVHTQRWLDYFTARGYQVVIAPAHGDEEADRALLASVQPDLVHGHSITTWGWRAAALGFHPLVLTAWGEDLLIDINDRECEQASALALAAADLVTADSRQLLTCAQRLGARQLELIRFGADLGIFTVDGDGGEWRAQLGLSPQARPIFSARAFDWRYNIDIIAAAMPAVVAQFPHARFLFSTYQCTTAARHAYRASIEASMAAAGVRGCGYFLPALAPHELQQVYRLAEVVVSIPSQDGFPVTVFEALACARTVVVGDLPAYDDIVIDGETGVRVAPRDAERLGQTLCQLLAAPAAAARLAEAGHRLACQQGDFRREMARMETCYQALAARK